MKPDPLGELFPLLPWAGNRHVLADWDNNCVRPWINSHGEPTGGWPFTLVRDGYRGQTTVEFIDDEGQLWRGLSSFDFPGIISCRLIKPAAEDRP